MRGFLWIRLAVVAVVASLLGATTAPIPSGAVQAEEEPADRPVEAEEVDPSRAPVGGAPVEEEDAPDPDVPVEPIDGTSDVVFVDPSEDGLQVVVGDGDGARVIARLAVPGIVTRMWTGYGCVTGTGRYVGAVFAPAEIVDTEAQDDGAFLAVVDLEDGQVEVIEELVALRYHSPGCGVGDEVAAVRYTDEGRTTEFVLVDASTGTAKVERVDARLTFPAPDAEGGVLAAGGDVLVQVDADGDVDVVGETDGEFVDVHASADGGADFLVVSEEGEAEARSIDDVEANPGAGEGELVAEGDVGELEWSTGADGENLLVADKDVDVVDRSVDVVEVEGGDLPDAVALDGESTAEVRVVDDATEVAVTDIEPTRGRLVRGRLMLANPLPGEFRPVDEVSGLDGRGVSTAAGLLRAVDLPAGSNVCAVPVNDPRVQVVQPSPRQVEWAAHRVVRGVLNVQRPAGWQNNGLSSYSPQGEFPRLALDGGGRIPAQVLLGVLAQESNLWQASRGAIPGVASSPIVGNYFGVEFRSGRIVSVNPSKADCGYGVGQVTDGMRRDQVNNPYSAAQQKMIATDYLANMAAAHNILADKWNDLRRKGMITADMDPSIAENWYLALWAYNSGYKVNASPFAEGLGWTNNPANSDYKFDRRYYLRAGYDDAKRPADWSYPERVLGYVEHGFKLRGQDAFESGLGVLELPVVIPPNIADDDSLSELVKKYRSPVDRFVFCSIRNQCSPTHFENGSGAERYDRSFCTRDDRKCWWNTSASFLPPPPGTGVTERANWIPGESEPGVRNPYPAACEPNDAEMPPFATLDRIPDNAIIIDDVARNTPNLGGCSNVKTSGTFDINFAQPLAAADFGQIGTGYGGHFYFTHTNWPSRPGHTITGTWRPPSGTTGWHRVLVHIPTVGADTYQADYKIYDGSEGVGDPPSYHRVVNQRWNQNQWVDLGFFQLSSGARIELSNETYSDHGQTIGDTARQDPFYSSGRPINIAWDAVALIPSSKPTTAYVALGDGHASGAFDNGPSTPSTDIDTTTSNRENRCQRKERWLPEDLLPELESADPGALGTTALLKACEGARLGRQIGGAETRWGEVPQLKQGWLDGSTTHVSLHAGEADLQLYDRARFCVDNTDCAQKVFAIGNAAQQDELPIKAQALVDDTRDALDTITAEAPNAQVVLFGVPDFLQNVPGIIEDIPLRPAWCKSTNVTDAEREWLNRAIFDVNNELRNLTDGYPNVEFRPGPADGACAPDLWGTLPEPMREAVQAAVDFVSGCVAYGVDAAGDIIDSLEQVVAFLDDPNEFVNEKLLVIKELYSGFQDDPAEFVEELRAEVAEELLQIERLNENPVDWAGYMGCQIAVALITGGGVFAKVAPKLVTFLNTRFPDVDFPDRKPGDRSPDRVVCKINSFPTGTPVLMSDGSSLPIESVRPGDLVVTYDLDTRSWGRQSVLDQWSGMHTDSMVTVVLDDGSEISATDDHRFWVNSKGEWVEADRLVSGDLLLGPDGVSKVTDVLVELQGPTLVWELDTAVDNNFVVGDRGHRALVHNADCSPQTALMDLLATLRDKRNGRNLDANYGPAESIAAGIKDGEVIETGPHYNIFRTGDRLAARAYPRKDMKGPAETLEELVRGVERIENPNAYIDALTEVYAATGTALHPDVAAAVRQLIARDDFVLSSAAGKHPGAHAEVFAVNALLQRGVDKDDIVVATIKADGSDFPACSSCGTLLDILGIPDENILTG